MIDSATNKRPVILQVLHSLQLGGAEILAARLARQLQTRYEFVFACLDHLGLLGEELRSEGFQIEVLERRPGVDIRCVRHLAQFAAKIQAGVIQAHQYTPFFYARAPGWLGKRAAVLFTEHGRHVPDLPSLKRRMFNRLFIRRQDRVIAVGEAVKQALVNVEQIPPAKVQVIHNGVKLHDFLGDATQRVEVRCELGIPHDVPVVIQVARLHYLKDHLTAVRVAERVKARFPNVQFLFVGEGPERAKIDAEITARKLQPTVRLLGLRTDVRRLLTAADIFSLTSISEGIPVTLIKAMAARLPIVATAVGGIEEVVRKGETGWVAPAGNDEALAAQVIQLLEQPEQARTFGLTGEARAREQFSEERMHEAYVKVYEEMLRARGRV